MKKNLVAGIFAAGLIVAGGTGFYFGNVKENAQLQPMSNRANQMTQMMNTNNNQALQGQPLVQQQNQAKDQDALFKQMLPFMKKMHPNLSEKELKSLFESMHGANGAPGCGAGQGQGMMGTAKTSNNF